MSNAYFKPYCFSPNPKPRTPNSELQRSIQLRNGSIVPLGFLQVSLLKRLRQHGGAGMIYSRYSKKELLDGALLTINGIAAGMRNTG